MRDVEDVFSRSELQRAEPIARQVYRKLRQAIISRRLPTGERLREADLAKALGVSRTPVREAIARLVSDRLVRPLPGGGVEIADTGRELEEIYHVRRALEGYAARLAAERRTPEELQALAETVDGSTKAASEAFEQRAVLNEQFHRLIAGASRVPRLIEMIQEFREYATNEVTLSLYDRESSERGLDAHREILRWLREGNSERAEQAMREHLDSAYRATVSAGQRPVRTSNDTTGGQRWHV